MGHTLRGLFCLSILLGACTVSATASPVLWTLVDVAISSGGEVTGSFVWDADSSTLTNISLDFSDAADLELDGSLTNGSLLGPDLFSFFQIPTIYNPGVWLNPSATLTDSGGSISLSSESLAGFCELTSLPDCASIGALSSKGLGSLLTLSGSLLGTPIPEVSPLQTLVFGLIGMAACGLRTARRSTPFVARR